MTNLKHVVSIIQRALGHAKALEHLKRTALKTIGLTSIEFRLSLLNEPDL